MPLFLERSRKSVFLTSAQSRRSAVRTGVAARRRAAGILGAVGGFRGRDIGWIGVLGLVVQKTLDHGHAHLSFSLKNEAEG
jgi:hypothetical protein